MNYVLSTLRLICLSYPDASESQDHPGEICFRVAGKPFVKTDGQGCEIHIKLRKLTQALLLEQPGHAKSPHVGHHGWTSIPIPGNENSHAEWAHVKRLIHEAYLAAAPGKYQSLVTERS